MLSAGEIMIQMQPQSSHCNVTVTSTRPQFVSKLFAGKPIAHMLNSVPLLFNVCRAAQSVACVRATEQALGVTAPTAIEKYREQLVRFEMLHEHLWKLLIDLPTQLGLTPWQQPMIAASQQLQPLLRQMQFLSCRLSTQLTTWKIPLPELKAELRETLQRLLFGPCQSLHNYDEVLQSEGVAGQLLQSLQKFDFSGNLDWSLPAPLDKKHLHQRLTEQAFMMERDCFSENTVPVDNGPLARMKNHACLQHNLNTALAPRLLSILAETDTLLEDDKFILAETNDDPDGINSINGFGISEVETARGRLQHIVLLDDKSAAEPALTQMQVIAPTDWHFHATGIAAHSLAGIPNEPALLQSRAELMVKLINPCVGYQINIAQHQQEARSHA